MECDYCIVGGGIAGVSCIYQLYQYDEIYNGQKTVVMVSNSDYLKVGKVKCQISKTLDELEPVIKNWNGIFGENKNFTFICGKLNGIYPKSKLILNKIKNQQRSQNNG